MAQNPIAHSPPEPLVWPALTKPQSGIRSFIGHTAQQAHEKVVAFVAERMANDEKSRLMRFAHRGLIDRLKQQGLYVDIAMRVRLLRDCLLNYGD
jgi:hypothetical protein